MTGESGEPMATISLPVELSIECEVGSGQYVAEKSQDVLFKVTS
jgi:hypothetical protein